MLLILQLLGVTQQARNPAWELDEAGLRPTLLIRDQDGKFPSSFDAVFASEGARVIRMSLRAVGNCGRRALGRGQPPRLPGEVVQQDRLGGMIREYALRTAWSSPPESRISAFHTQPFRYRQRDPLSQRSIPLVTALAYRGPSVQ